MTLTEFLLARNAEDEDAARDWAASTSAPPSGPNAASHPARVLAECEAKRRIVELHTPLDGEQSDPSCGDLWHPCKTLMALALPYADHPDYREEWKP